MTPHEESHRTIVRGAILVQEGTLLPPPLRLERDSTNGWVAVAGNPDGRQLEKELSAAGWTLFYTAGAIGTTAFGFDRQSMIQTALKRLVKTVGLNRCNCLEIDHVAARSFLGMPYVSLSAHLRHVQKGSDEQEK